MANWTDAGVHLDADSEIPLTLLLMLRLKVYPLHLRVENLDVVQLQRRVGGRRAARCRAVQITHRLVALSAKHSPRLIGVTGNPMKMRSKRKTQAALLTSHTYAIGACIQACAATSSTRCCTSQLTNQFSRWHVGRRRRRRRRFVSLFAYVLSGKDFSL